MQSLGARSQTRQGSFGVDSGNVARQTDNTLRERGGPEMILRYRDVLEKPWARADKGDERRVTVRRNGPQQLYPIFKALGQRSQDLAAGDQKMKCDGAATLEKTRHAL